MISIPHLSNALIQAIQTLTLIDICYPGVLDDLHCIPEQWKAPGLGLTRTASRFCERERQVEFAFSKASATFISIFCMEKP
jgi:hypothetical protein